MNPATLCAWHIWKLRRPDATLRLTIITDDRLRFPRADLVRMLAPWSAWANIDSYQCVSPGYRYAHLLDDPLRKATETVGSIVSPPSATDAVVRRIR